MVNVFQILTNKQFQNIAISHFSTTFGTCLLIPILPVFLQGSGFSETQIGIIMGATAVSALIVRPWVGLQVDQKGSRPVILIGQMILILSTIGYWWTTSFWFLIVLRLLYGIGQALYGTGAVTFASSIGTGETKSNSIAMYTLTTMFGLGISMSLAQAAFDNFGFHALVGMSVILMGIAFSIIKWRSRPIKAAAGNTAKVPFMEVLKSEVVFATTLSQFAASFSFSALLTFIPLAALAGGIGLYSLFFMSFAVAVIGSRLFVRNINQFFGLIHAIVYASVTMFFSVVLLLSHMSPVILIVSGVLFGIGFGVVYPAQVLLVVERISPTNRGTALGIMIAAGDIGNALSTAILGGVAEHLGYRALFLTIALLLAVCTYYFRVIVDSGNRVETI